MSPLHTVLPVRQLLDLECSGRGEEGGQGCILLVLVVAATGEVEAARGCHLLGIQMLPGMVQAGYMGRMSMQWTLDHLRLLDQKSSSSSSSFTEATTTKHHWLVTISEMAGVI